MQTRSNSLSYDETSTSSSINLLGQVTWLWLNSPLQKDWPLHLLSTNVIPAITHKQFLLLKQDEFAVAYCSWALLDQKTEKCYLADPHSLNLEDWTSGNRMWIVDWVAPFGHTFVLYQQMRSRFPDAIARALRVDPHTKTARIQEIKGKAVPKAKADMQFAQYFSTLIEDKIS